MEWRCRQEIEDALWDAAREQLRPQDLGGKSLIRAIEARTALYTTEREKLVEVARSAMHGADLAARALFFGIADAAKISIALSELLGRGCLPPGQHWRVLDLGAGAGAMGLGLLSFIAEHHPGVSVEIDAVDLDEAALSLYSRAVEKLAGISGLDIGDLRIRTVTASVGQWQPDRPKYDLVVLGSVLNELRSDARAPVAISAMAALQVGGAMIVVEPALRETSRALHQVRDALIETGSHIFAPCTRAQAPCPALEDERDWCHEDRAGVLPKRARQLAQATGLRDGGLKFSYLVARHGDDALVSKEKEGMALRVVGQPRRGKGQRECFVCGEIGRRKLRLLKRNRSSKNRLIERAKRGDVLLTHSGQGTDTQTGLIEVAKDLQVTLLRPAELL